MPRYDPTGPPDDLDNEARALWRKTRKQLQAQGTWQDQDKTTLERYIRAEARARLAREERGERMTTLGSKGQEVAHPLLRVEREAEQDAQRYAEALLLPASARQRADVKPPAKGGKLGL